MSNQFPLQNLEEYLSKRKSHFMANPELSNYIPDLRDQRITELERENAELRCRADVAQVLITEQENSKLEEECDQLRAKVLQLNSLVDWAESLLCNATPMSHCTQEEWDKTLKNWRDDKHTKTP